MAARWFDIVLIGEFGCCWSRPDGCLVNERIFTKDHTCTLASDDPERTKLDVGSTSSEVTGCRCDGVVATCRPVKTCEVSDKYLLPKKTTYLPQYQPAALCAQDQDIAIVPSRNRNAAYPLRERNGRLLIPPLPAVHMDHRLLCLRCKYMRRAHRQTIGGSRALLEGRAKYRRWLKLMDADSNISQRRGRGSLARCQGRCYEAFRQHDQKLAI